MQSQAGGVPWEVIGQAFVTKYYEVFDSNKDQIIALYHQEALLTFEDNQARGPQLIQELLTSKLRFQKIAHQITKVDCQPTSENGVLVFVTGRLKTDDDPPHAFSQVFYIKPFNDSYFIFHDMFRLSIHDTM